MKKTLLLCIPAALLLLTMTASVMNAQDYVGSQRCMPCHSGIHTDWKASGHPYKLQKLSGDGPVYPEGLSSRNQVGPLVDYTIQPGVPQPPKGYTWDQVGWVLGGFHSNARFIDTEGYVIVGAETRYNIPTDKWVRYDQDDPGRKTYAYSCYRCHTTGASRDKTPEFEAYPGIEGSWTETGVGCEACHGPGSQHVMNPTNKPPKEGYATCTACHARDRSDTNKRVEWRPERVNDVETGFVRHREQGDMMEASKHFTAGMSCVTCHNPHKSVYYNAGGIKAAPNCESCHQGKNIPGHTAATCIDCHMPYAAKSGVSFTPYVADQSGHFWKIITEPITLLDNIDETFIAGKKYINVDENGMSGLTLDYSCLQCHVNQDVTWASGYAKKIHEIGVSVQDVNALPTAFGLRQNYPNPFNPSTTITFLLPMRSPVRIDILDQQGRLVTTLLDDERDAGVWTVDFNAEGLPSGVYFYRMTSNARPMTKKMALIR